MPFQFPPRNKLLLSCSETFNLRYLKTAEWNRQVTSDKGFCHANPASQRQRSSTQPGFSELFSLWKALKKYRCHEETHHTTHETLSGFRRWGAELSAASATGLQNSFSAWDLSHHTNIASDTSRGRLESLTVMYHPRLGEDLQLLFACVLLSR